MAGALEGIRILEFTEIIAAPFAGMHLADMGADIIKVEPPSGEPWRLPGQFAPGENRQFISLNRGKRGLAVDLKTPEGREIIYKLVPDIDVVIVNYRPDTPRVLGIDYDTLKELNPRLIYVQNTAFGLRGPAAHRPGYDIVAQAMTGLMATDNKISDTGLPMPANPAVADFATGITIVAAVCAALFARERTGKGQKVEASLMATALAMQTGQFLQMSANEGAVVTAAQRRIREARARGASWSEIVEMQAEARATAANSYYRCYHTQDGIIAVGCLSAVLRRKFVAAIDVPDARLADGYDGPRTGPEAQAIALEHMALCEVRMREKTCAEWLEILDACGVPAGEFKLVMDLHSDPQVLENGLRVQVEHPVAGTLTMVGPLINMSETPSSVKGPSPTIGQHNDDILRELGYADHEVDALRNKGVIPSVASPSETGEA